MTAPTTVGFYCPDCHRTETRPTAWATREWREDKPQYQYHFYSVPRCRYEHDMQKVDLCLACEAEGKVERTYESFGLCLKHAQLAASSQNLDALIREIALLPAYSDSRE
jgi:hypothetical protein